MSDVVLRSIVQEDNRDLARVIRSVQSEYGVFGPGTSQQDSSIDCMFETYAAPGSAYFVAEFEGRVMGGGGIAPLAGGSEEVCELQKMYLDPSLRGMGVGRTLLENCLDAARRLGYRQCYLETRSNMLEARKLYLRAGFEACSAPMGATGHYGCDAWFVRDLSDAASVS